MAFKPVKNIRDPPNQSAEVTVCGLLAVEYLLLPSLYDMQINDMHKSRQFSANIKIYTKSNRTDEIFNTIQVKLLSGQRSLVTC
jgi:hypothetical protein